MLRFLPLAVVTLLAVPGLASETPWQEIAPGVRARLISSDRLVAGGGLAGLELDLPAGTRTYWRIPGETGIPTTLDFTGSAGLADPAVQWPFPQIDRSQGYLDYVYSGRVVLPVRFTPAAGNASLSIALTLGICSDICIPAVANFALPLSFARPDPAQALRLDQAMATVPIPWDGAGEPLGSVSVSPEGLAISYLDPAVDPSSILADVGDASVLFGAPQKSPDGTIWTLYRLGGATEGLEGRSVRLTFMTATGPYAVTRAIAPPA